MPGRPGARLSRHGFRSSFRDWAAERTDHPREVIEAALAHLAPDEAGTSGRICFDRRRHLDIELGGGALTTVTYLYTDTYGLTCGRFPSTRSSF